MRTILATTDSLNKWLHKQVVLFAITKYQKTCLALFQTNLSVNVNLVAHFAKGIS